MCKIRLFSSVFSFLWIFSAALSKSNHEKLLVVSYDGFRFDYLDLYKNITPVLNHLKSSSAYAKCLLNVFPTQTFPNHFSIATGVYTGVHGVLGSSVYDKEKKKVLKYSYDLFHYNNDLLPIWTLNQKAGNGRHSGVSMWPGSDFVYGNTNMTFFFKYNSTVPLKHRVNEVMGWFTHKTTPANFVMLYFEKPDDLSHAFGPYSTENRKDIKLVDDITQYILDSLKNNNLDDVNVIFLSDHGMESVTMDHIIDLRTVAGDIADFYGTSPVLQVYPRVGSSIDEVYGKLKNFSDVNKHFRVYLQENIPEHFQIRWCKRTPPILAVADPPYAFQDLYDGIDWYVKNRNAPYNGTYGVHGYDPQEVNMHPYFIAHGPAFKKNFYAGELRTIDMYSLFAHTLKLDEPKSVRPNGTFSKVSHLFSRSSVSSGLPPGNLVYNAYIVSGAVVCVIAIFTASVCCFKKRRKEVAPIEDIEVQEVEKLLDGSNA